MATVSKSSKVKAKGKEAAAPKKAAPQKVQKSSSKGDAKMQATAQVAKIALVPTRFPDMSKAPMAEGCCRNCGTDAKSRRRTFSEQAWTVLLIWNEINPSAVDQPICDDCYKEMRDILIDRTDEIEQAMQSHNVPEMPYKAAL